VHPIPGRSLVVIQMVFTDRLILLSYNDKLTKNSIQNSQLKLSQNVKSITIICKINCHRSFYLTLAVFIPVCNMVIFF
jgi:hypothetical protein